MSQKKISNIILCAFSMCFVSCFLMTSAAKEHYYSIINNRHQTYTDSLFKLVVISTMGNKLFLFKNMNDKKIDSVMLCNPAYKKNSWFKFSIDSVSEKYYLLNLKISDFKFYKRIEQDTIRIIYYQNKKVNELQFIYNNPKK